MKRIAPVVLAVALTGCGEREVVTVDETRRVTMRDEGLRFDVDSEQRYSRGEPRPTMAAREAESPLIAGEVPMGWQELPATSFRLLNYGFGDGGEVYLSTSRGGLLENVNRWRRQFGLEPLTQAELDELEAVRLPGYLGVWVEAEGTYAAGMGREAAEGMALRGVVAESEGEILTVKMVGPRLAVEAEEGKLRAFLAGLKPAN